MNKLTKFLIFATIFLIPAYLIRFSVFGIPTNILELLIYAACISFLLEKTRINWKEFYRAYSVYIILIALIFLGLILSTLINGSYQTGFGIIKSWFFDPLLFSFILIQKIKERDDIENILKLLYTSAFAISLAALGYFFLGKLTFDGRLAAFYASPNYLGMFLAPAVFIGIYALKLQITNYKLQKNGLCISLYSICLLIILAVLYLTYSYAAWFAIILSLLIVELLKIKNRFNFKKIIIFIFISLALIVTQINNPKLKDSFSDRSSLESRIMIWKSAIKIAGDNFIFGIGPGNFQNNYLKYQKYFPPYLEWAVPEPHNVYIAFWLESGLIGLMGFISLIALWLKQALKNSANHSHAVFLGFMLYILIHGMVDTPYWKNDLSLVFWLLFFLMLIASKIDAVQLPVSSVNKK